MHLKNRSQIHMQVGGIHLRPGDVLQINDSQSVSKNLLIYGVLNKNGRTYLDVEPNPEDLSDNWTYEETLHIDRVTQYLREKEQIGLLEKAQRILPDRSSSYRGVKIWGIRLKIWYEVVLPEVKRLANVVSSSVYWEDEEDPHAVCRVRIWIGDQH